MNKNAKTTTLACGALLLLASLPLAQHYLAPPHKSQSATQQLLDGLRKRATARTTPVGDLLARGADVNARDSYGNTPLMHAAQRAPREIGTLLDHGAEVNARNKTGVTSLFAAIGYANVESVRLLLSRGADPNLKASFRSGAEQQFTALAWTRESIKKVRPESPIVRRWLEIIQLLQAAGARE